MEERKTVAADEYSSQDSQPTKKDKNEQCKSDLHRWITRPSPLRTCSIFADIAVKLVACGEGHVILVSDNLKVFSVGSNEYGQLGLGDLVDRKTPREVNFLSEKFVNRVSSGARHSCAISKKGQVFCWGDSRSGQCGQGEKGIFTTPCRVRFVDRTSPEMKVNSTIHRVTVAQEISCGEKHTLATDTQGILWSWGSGLATGQGLGDEEILSPMKVKKMSKKRVVQIACGKLHSVVLVQGDVNMNQETLQNEIVCSSVSDDGQDSLHHSDSNVTQKIPFLENVFYIEEEDGPINWSMDLQKLSRSNTPVFYDEENNFEFQKSEMDLEQEGESHDKTCLEYDTPRESSLCVDSSQISQANPTGDIRSNIIASCDESNKVKDSPEPRSFDNKLNCLIEDLEVASRIKSKQGDRRSSSFQDLTTGFEESIPSRSKSDDNLQIPKGKLTENSHHKKGNLQLPPSEHNEKPVNVSEVQLIEKSTNDLYYSALDVVSKKNRENRSKDSVTNTYSSSTTVSASCHSLDEERTESAGNPLNLSMDKSMENMILSQSCSVVVDETQAEKAPTSNAEGNTSAMRDRSASAWSIATTGSTYEVDKIGSVMLYGTSQIWAWGENSKGQLGIGDNTLVIKER